MRFFILVISLQENIISAGNDNCLDHELYSVQLSAGFLSNLGNNLRPTFLLRCTYGTNTFVVFKEGIFYTRVVILFDVCGNCKGGFECF